MRSVRRLFALSATLCAGTLAFEASAAAPPGTAHFGPDDRERAVLAPTSFDAVRNVPTFLWAGRAHPLPPPADRTSAERAARWYLALHASDLGLTPRSLETVTVLTLHDTGRGGIAVSFGQEVAGVDVYGERLTVLMNRQSGLVAISGTLHSAAVGGSASGRLMFTGSDREAVAQALSDESGERVVSDDLRLVTEKQGGYRLYGLRSGTTVGGDWTLVDPGRAKRVYYPEDDHLVPAYYVEVTGEHRGDTLELVAYVIGANDGMLLHRESLTQKADFTYRVWTDGSDEQRPLAGPQADYSPHPAKLPDNTNPDFIASDLVTFDGFNLNPEGGSDPWLPAGAVATTGNNVNAYADLYDPDGFSDGDIQPFVSLPGVFDYVYDTTLGPLADASQSMASIVQLFYVNNWLHDWFYDSGFTETAGVAQVLNFGRGGLEGDPIKAEGQDAATKGIRNNANMSTPADGASPRMQMYLWTGEQNRTLTVSPIELSTATGTAAFGPTNFDVTGSLVLADDGVAPLTDACTPLVNTVAGMIVVIDRGTCTFKQKALYAEAAGAIGVIIVDNRSATVPPGMSDPDPAVPCSTPTLSVLQSDGTTIKNSMAIQPTSARMFRETGVERDGTIDDSVIAHEWGHYIHHRLVSACSTTQCASQSEGWADFLASHMLMQENDDPLGTYAVAIYAGAYLGDSGYFGIRRVPYSADFTRNALTFRHIQNGEPLPTSTTPMAVNSSPNAEVHNAGEVWATMVWEAYIALQGTTGDAMPRYTFDEARRLMSDYLVLGMMMAPPEPTFTEQRDGLLAAAAANDSTDLQVLAEAFARRGAGTCAVSPPRGSTDLLGVVESYQLSPNLAFVDIQLHEGDVSCDGDGVVDAGESGVVIVNFINTGALPLDGTEVELTISSPDITLMGSPTVVVGSVAPFEMGTARFPVSLADSITDIFYADIQARVFNPSACVAEVSGAATKKLNYDDLQGQSATDTVESETLGWLSVAAVGSPDIWSRDASDPTNGRLHGLDPNSLSDVSLVSPPLVVGATPFSMAFDHAWKFETSSDSSGNIIYWDGSVIEISADGGITWEDVSLYTEPGYNGVIGNTAGNPLMDRMAYVDHNAAWPELEHFVLDFGTAFAGKTVLVRLRIGADQASGDTGWHLDNLAFTGITNTPFAVVVPDQTILPPNYPDEDGDGFGVAGQPAFACTPPPGYSANDDDCNDGDMSIYPGAPEVCDGIDNNCGQDVDEGFDQDGDGFTTCGGDCDDTNANAFPGNTEVRDGVDNDCDGQVDESGCGGSPAGRLGSLSALLPYAMVGLLLRRRSRRR